MTESPVRQFGEVSDVDGVRVHIGVDHDVVKVGRYRLGRDVLDDFHRLMFEAERAAEEYDRGEFGLDEEAGCVCGQTAAGCAETGRQAAQRIGTVHD